MSKLLCVLIRYIRDLSSRSLAQYQVCLRMYPVSNCWDVDSLYATDQHHIRILYILSLQLIGMQN